MGHIKMADGLFLTIATAAPLAASAVLCLALTRALISLLRRRGRLVADFHKKERPMIPHPGGPAIFISIASGELLLYLLTGDFRVFTLAVVVLIIGVVGLVDDLKPMSGVIKPVVTIFGALPMIVWGTYDSYLSLPFFGEVRLSIIYPLLVLLAVPVVSNTINSIDVLNGVVSSFMIIAIAPLALALALKGEYAMMLASAVVISSLAVFYRYHRFPSKIFPGDSGSLTLGAAYASLAIMGGVEIVAVVALLPAILNSFFFLASVRRFVEHRALRERPAALLEDGRIVAAESTSAPVTIVRLITAGDPKTEQEVFSSIVKLAAISALLAAATAFTLT